MPAQCDVSLLQVFRDSKPSGSLFRLTAGGKERKEQHAGAHPQNDPGRSRPPGRPGPRGLVDEVHKVIIGQDEMIEQMLICTFARGHCLTIGVPGLAKTLTVSTLAQALHLKFTRIQFTPDLMPSDITGTEIIDQDPASGKRSFRFVRGPVFSNILLADEINRTPPKTQAALLQAMQEHEVTVAGNTYKLDPPFFVMATQNPIEQEGTYPLPEAQLDRFMLSINIGYPDAERGTRDRDGHHADDAAGSASGAAAARTFSGFKTGAAGAGHSARGRLRGRSGPGHAAEGAAEPRFHEELAGVGRGTTGGAVHDSGGKGPRDFAWAVCRRVPTTSGRWPIRCCGIGCSRTSTPTPRGSTWIR